MKYSQARSTHGVASKGFLGEFPLRRLLDALAHCDESSRQGQLAVIFAADQNALQHSLAVSVHEVA